MKYIYTKGGMRRSSLEVFQNNVGSVFPIGYTSVPNPAYERFLRVTRNGIRNYCSAINYASSK
jgi:hypothetical protein